MTRLEFMKLTKAQRQDVIEHVRALRAHDCIQGEDELACVQKTPKPVGCWASYAVAGRLRSANAHGFDFETMSAQGFIIQPHTTGDMPRAWFKKNHERKSKDKAELARTLFTKRRIGE